MSTTCMVATGFFTVVAVALVWAIPKIKRAMVGENIGSKAQCQSEVKSDDNIPVVDPSDTRLMEAQERMRQQGEGML